MDWSDYLRFIVALAFVIGLIGVLAWAVRRSGFVVRPTVAGGGVRRLAVVEVRPLDAKHKLVLVSRDDTEHLILLGGTSDRVIEQNIPARKDGA